MSGWVIFYFAYIVFAIWLTVKVGASIERVLKRAEQLEQENRLIKQRIRDLKEARDELMVAQAVVGGTFDRLEEVFRRGPAGTIQRHEPKGV